MSKTKQLSWVLMLSLSLLFLATNLSAQYNTYDIATASGIYNFSYTQAPGNLIPVNAGNTGTVYSWESSPTPLFDGTVTTVATTASYNLSSPLAQTTYFRRKTSIGSPVIAVVTSNVIKINVVSQNWEDINYIREHDILVTGETNWEAIDQLPIGSKLQTTTYLDGLGRLLEKVSRETATPPSGTLWGDVVQFSQYDVLGRQPKQYLPYTTITESGKYKSTPLTEQPAYYTNNYNETSAYSNTTFDNSPLNRVTNVKSPGTSWAAGAGNSEVYDLNDATDNVQIFTIGYNPGDYPVSLGAYPAYTLLKTTHLDEYGKQVIEYTNKSGQLILTKTQIDDVPSAAHAGWICVYSVYDDFGLLRYRIQPEGVKYLDANGWTFAGTNGQQVLAEQCFRYDYDSKGRNILKKAPGAKALNMMYDSRDRIVLMQDGNQSDKTPNAEWTANIYDDLDRLTITTLYRPAKTQAQLQADIDNAITSTSVSVVNANQLVPSLVVDNRISTVATYTAQNSIEFVPGFTSGTNDAFVAQIDPAATQSTTVTTTTYNNPITNTDLNNTSLNTIVKYLFYDDYSYAGAKSFDNNFDNTTAYSNSDPNVIPIATSQRTLSFPTGSMVRVLGTNTFLTSTEYYDEKGRHIQSIEDNIKSGKDVTTLQYQWDGRLLSSHTKHTTANTGYANFSILTKNVFDKIGRVTSLMKNYGANGFKTIASYDLDDMGRLKTKHLDPGYTGSGKTEMESLTYSYNIQNNITGINKDYALKTSGSYDKWANFFGMYLGYDNRDAVFNAAKLDGHVTGILWNTEGDDAQRKYDYTYDNAGRLTKADYRERQTTGAAWDNSKMDFTVGGSGATGKIEYDLNGNLTYMLQKGVVPGGTGPVTIDDLHYSYASYSNKLTKVADNSTLGATNGMFGDFKDGANSGDDYVYDDNGNLIIDLNKNAANATGGVTTPIGTSGIIYNFLDKPEVIKITGKGTINIVYDADGNKLQKTYTPETGSPITTSYVNEFVYKGDVLQYINFEEGRIRVVTPVSSGNGYDGLTIDGNIDLPSSPGGVGGGRGAFDFFIRDYQQNVRMILTEETHYGINECTMESARAGNEEPYFGQTGTGNEVAATRFAKPVGWSSNTSSSVSRLSKLSGHTIGPNSLLKVMADDVINAQASYYYPAAVTNNHNSLVTDIVGALVQSITSSNVTPTLVHGNTGNISNDLSTSIPFASVTDPNQNATDNIPRAYLNIVFFDERFNFVSEGSTAIRVSQPGDNAAPLVLPLNTKAPKNGYAYIYLSNENDDAVYFDNFTVSDTRGRIIEEDHYYAFGLKIAGISSKKLGDVNEGLLENKNLYNDKELIDEADLNWYDYGFRNYDAQIGRFTQLDPLTDGYPHYTPFQYAGNEPIANVDMDGLEELNTIGDFFKVGGKVEEKALQSVILTANKVAPAASTAFNLFKLSTRLAPLVTKLAVVHSEQSFVSRQLQASIQFQSGMEARKEKAAKIKLKERVEAIEETDRMIRDGLWDPDLSDDEARTNFLNLSIGLTLPNAYFRPATILLNANKIGSAVENGLIKVYRVFGGRSQQFGESWTTVNPKFFGQGYRNLAGLPNTNTGDNIVEGFVKWSDIEKVRPSLPLGGNTGGLPEVIIKNSAKKIIDPTSVTLKTRF
jgi:RHS repeat-associated protein